MHVELQIQHDRTGYARLVLDDDTDLQGLSEFIGNDALGHVGGAAGSTTGNQTKVLVRIVLGQVRELRGL